MTEDPEDVEFALRRSVQLAKEGPDALKAASKASLAAHCPHCGVKHRTITPDQCVDRKMSETKLSDRVIYRAKKYGWRGAHAGRLQLPDGQWITPMAKGWPDWSFAKEGHRMIFMELKKELGEVEPDQAVWLQLLNLTGNFAIVVRPSDLREGRVNVIFREGAPL